VTCSSHSSGFNAIRIPHLAAIWLCCWALLLPAAAGWIEDTPEGTVIHVKVFGLPEPTDTSTFNRSEVAGVRLFKERFSEIFAERYRDKYKADPEKYGDHDWDNVQVNLYQATGIRVEGVETDLLMIAGEQAPDVLYVNFRKSSTYIDNGFLYPLDKPEDGYLAGPGALTEEEQEFRIHHTLWPVIRRKAPTGAEHVWCVPYGGVLGKVLLYRRDLFDVHGIPYPDETWTWEQMLDACKKISNPAEDTFGIWNQRGKHESWYWKSYCWSMGGELMMYDVDNDQWSCTFDSRAAAIALDYYLKLIAERWHTEDGSPQRGYSSRDVGNESQTKWEEGKIGMMLSYIDEKLFSKVNPDVTGLAPVPLGFEDENGVRHRGAELNSRMMGLFAKIEQPAVRDAAWEYIRFYDNEEAMAMKTRIMVEGGFGRFMNPRYLNRYGYEDLVRLSPPGWVESFEIAINTAKPEPYGRGSNLAYDMMTYPIQEAEQEYTDGRLPEDEEERIDAIQEILHKWTVKANEKMIGIIPPEEMRKRRISAWFAIALIATAFFFVFRLVFRAFQVPVVAGAENTAVVSWGFRKYWLAYLILLPAVLTILVWQYFPLARGTLMAFQDYNILGGSTWVWVDNFANLLWDTEENGWWESVWNSIRYSLLVVGLTFLPPIVLAILLQEVPVGTIFFRTVYYLPAVITGLVTMLLWKMFYTPTSYGILNQVVMVIPAIAYVAIGLMLLGVAWSFTWRLWFHDSHFPATLAAIAGVVLFTTSVGLAGDILFPEGESIFEVARQFVPRLFQTQQEPYRWLSDKNTAMLACVIPMVWAGMGPGCLIYLAALKGIADDFYEASDIDGATFVDKILFIIFPILKPLVIINFVGVFIGSWMQAENILAMTGGSAGTEVANLKIFFEAFTFLKMGPATAMAWVLATMLIGFTVYQLRILARLEFKTTGEK
jgi:multiple sugar transport system permease protein